MRSNGENFNTNQILFSYSLPLERVPHMIYSHSFSGGFNLSCISLLKRKEIPIFFFAKRNLVCIFFGMRLYRSVPVLGKPVPSKWGELLRKTKVIFDGGGGDFPIKTLWSTFSFIFNVPDSTLVVLRPGILWCKIFWQTPFSADNQGLMSTRYPTLPGFFFLLVTYPEFFWKFQGSG